MKDYKERLSEINLELDSLTTTIHEAQLRQRELRTELEKLGVETILEAGFDDTLWKPVKVDVEENEIVLRAVEISDKLKEALAFFLGPSNHYKSIFINHCSIYNSNPPAIEGSISGVLDLVEKYEIPIELVELDVEDTLEELSRIKKVLG